MNNTYQLRVESTCPSDASPDVYDVTISSGRTILVEDIQALVDELTDKPTFQEDLTWALARNLRAHVVTVGNHYGIVTTCEERG